MLDDSKPLFVAVAEQIEDGILDGTYAEDGPVPSTNELAAFLRINPATAGKGLGLLVDAEVLIKRRGIGMFVAPGAREALRQRRRLAFEDQYIAPLLREAEQLGISPDDLARMITKEFAR
ncbi:GntR family transcriptional regulator [Agrococcus sediminis]|jgi:GntR family transcriptional regulator|uniref:GntR family transcriptional regulator n=1 Tax=Agrococcus sediminis TaxID=2599924 RepID=A0A5M8QMS6_9MICO|nr:GntR family transcriptional regulator [Agrococcus sediminis]KAA6436274.1 GntR family transcriptional regulator [Agrococcus sediminis]